MTLPKTAKNWWDNEAYADERYATRRWGGDGTPERVAPTMNSILDNISQYISTHRSMEIVDLGCGPGRLLLPLAEHYVEHRFHGVDISVEMIRLATAGSTGVRTERGIWFYECNGTEIPADVPQADLIYSVEMFQHVNAATKRAYLAAIAAKLGKHGTAMVQFVKGVDEDGWVNHPETPGNMRLWARAAGLKVRQHPPLEQVHDEWEWMVLGK